MQGFQSQRNIILTFNISGLFTQVRDVQMFLLLILKLDDRSIQGCLVSYVYWLSPLLLRCNTQAAPESSDTRHETLSPRHTSERCTPRSYLSNDTHVNQSSTQAGEAWRCRVATLDARVLLELVTLTERRDVVTCLRRWRMTWRCDVPLTLTDEMT